MHSFIVPFGWAKTRSGAQMAQKLTLDTKKKSLACSEPKLQFHSLKFSLACDNLSTLFLTFRSIWGSWNLSQMIPHTTAWQIDFWGLKKTSLNWSGIPETIFTRKFFLELRMNVVLKKFDFHNHWKIISGPYISICPKTWSLSPYQKLCHLGRRWIDYRNYKELLPKINI